MLLRLSPHSILTGGLSLLMTVALPVSMRGQDPVQKPVPGGARVSDRLPAPQGISVRQTGSQVTLMWGAVEGARSYVLGRAVGNEGFRRLLDASTGPDTIYVDRQVTPGARHVYTVTAVSRSDVAGIRATSEAIVPSSPIVLYPQINPITVTASLTAPTAIAVSWNSPGANTEYYAVTHWHNGQVRENISRTDGQSLSRRDLPPGSHRFQVNAVGRDRSNMGVASSNVIEIAPAVATATPATPATSASEATATVLVSVAASATLRVGGTASLPAAGQWTSLNAAVATVTTEGTVTGRAAGTAQLVALGTASDGAVRVTVVRVVVQP